MGPYPYVYPWTYPYPYYPLYPQRPRRAPGETYALVISWIVTVAGGLSILCGLFIGLIAVVVANQGRFTSLLADDIILVPLITTLLGGGYALFAGISGIRRQRSPRFTLPRPWLFVGLTAVVLVAGVLLWQTQIITGPGDALANWPLVLLSGVLPALALLSFVTWRLRLPASRRHVWLSVFYGLTLGPLLAIILELLASLAIDSASLTNPGSLNPNDPSRVIRLLVEISVAAPLIEEMVKPLGAVLLMPRLRTASGAFLVGLAGGVGFDMFETTSTYIGTMGEADWVTVAIERVGASILHGLGAGMVALGWYYVFHGQGVPQRGLRVLGCFGYAVAQHAVNNAAGILVGVQSGPVGNWFAQPFYLGRMPLQNGILPFLGFDVLLFVVLVIVTGRLAKGEGADKRLSPTTLTQPALQSPLPAGAAAGGMPS
jgi:RsiW-degrading membrane proteinase PrsW (M82 family)